jgi:TolB-like protein/Tfp pilus assembly protein PilF
LAHRQAIYRHELDDTAYREKLLSAVGLGSRVLGGGPTKKRPKRWLAPVAALALLIILAGVFFSFQRTSNRLQVPVADVVAAPAVSDARAVLENSIAVLPFENLSPNPDDAYFAAGIHEEILNQLTKISDLSVIARTSVMQYGGVHRPISEIARELRVGTVMEGSVRYAGDRVRISAQLIDAVSGAHLWSDVYERQLQDIFGVQLDIATQIANALKVELSPEEADDIATRVTDNQEAYAYYLKALSLMGNFANLGPIHEALDVSIAMDPEFASALGYKAWMYSLEAGFPQFQPAAYTSENERRLLRRAAEVSDAALALNPDLPFALLASGNVDGTRQRVRANQQKYERALELNPNDWRIMTSAGGNRLQRGEHQAGIELMSRAVELNPADAATIWFFSNNLASIRRWDEAQEMARRAVVIAPDAAIWHANLALISGQAGDVETARSAARTAESLGAGLYPLADVALAYELIGDLDDARRVVALAQSLGGADVPDPTWHFAMQVAVGDTDAAMDYLERAVDEHFPAFVSTALILGADTPRFDPVRDNPRFEPLVERVRAAAPDL